MADSRTRDLLRRAKKPPFALIPDALWDMPDLSVTARLLYVYLCHLADWQERSAFPSYATTARSLNCARRTAMRATKELVDCGLVVKESRTTIRGDRTSNVYVLLEPDDVQPGPAPSAHDEGDKVDGGGDLKSPPSDCESPRGANVSPPPKKVSDLSPRRARVSGRGPNPNKIQLTRFTDPTTAATEEKLRYTGADLGLTNPAAADAAAVEHHSGGSEGWVHQEELSSDDHTPWAKAKGPEAENALCEALGLIVGEALAKRWMSEFGPTRVAEVYRWSRLHPAQNPGGYMRTALRERWPTPAPVAVKERQAHAAMVAEEKRKREEDARKARQEELETRLRWWNSLSDGERVFWWREVTEERLVGELGFDAVLARVFLKGRGTDPAKPGQGWLSAAFQIARASPEGGRGPRTAPATGGG